MSTGVVGRHLAHCHIPNIAVYQLMLGMLHLLFPKVSASRPMNW